MRTTKKEPLLRGYYLINKKLLERTGVPTAEHHSSVLAMEHYDRESRNEMVRELLCNAADGPLTTREKEILWDLTEWYVAGDENKE